MGGATAAARDRAMENLIADHLAQCSTIRTATRVADASDEDNQPAKPAAAPARPRPIPVAVPSHVAAAQALDGEGEGDDAADDDQPTISVSAVRKVSWPSVSDGAPAPPRAIDERQAAAEPALDAPPPAKAPGSGATRLVWTKGPDPAAKPNGDADRAGAKAAPGTAVADRSLDRSNDETEGERKGLDHPDRRRRRPRQGAGADRQGASARPRRPRRGEAHDGEGAQRQRHVLSRPFRRSPAGLGRNRLSLAQEERLRLLRRS